MKITANEMHSLVIMVGGIMLVLGSTWHGLCIWPLGVLSTVLDRRKLWSPQRLNPATFVPNPDYYSALLWSRLMGTQVLETTNNGSPYFRSYTHCSKNGQGVTSLFINLSNSTSSDVSFVGDYNLYPSATASESSDEDKGPREEYHLTPEGGNLKSHVMLLNGQPLRLTADNQIPELKPLIVDCNTPLRIAPYSVAFIRYKKFNAPACIPA